MTLPLACENDRVSGPGQKTRVATLPAGEYEIAVAAWACGSADTVWEYESETECHAVATDDDNSVFPCPVRVSGDSVWFDCTEIVETNWGCTITRQYDMAGTHVGDTWEMTGTVHQTAQPEGCFPRAACTEVYVLAERTGPPPAYCAYGPINTIVLDVTGGTDPVETQLPAEAWAGVDVDGLYYGVYSSSMLRTAGDAVGIAFGFDTPSIDAETLPRTFDVVVQPPFERSVPELHRPPDGVVAVTYTDWPSDAPSQFFQAISASGTLTIVAMTEDFIAGSFDCDVDGVVWMPSGNLEESRTLEGVFNVENAGPIR